MSPACACVCTCALHRVNEVAALEAQLKELAVVPK